MRLADSRDGAPAQLVNVDARNLVAHVGIESLTLLTQQLPQFRNRCRWHLASAAHLFEGLKRDIQFADRPKSAGQSADLAHNLAAR